MASQSSSSGSALHTFLSFNIGGLSCGTASTLTNPLDVVRIRMQNRAAGDARYSGMLSALRLTFKEEGMAGMTRGLYASWARELTYSSARIGLYDPIRLALARGEEDRAKVGLHVKFGAGLLSGAIGSAVCNPCDFIKTRQQKPVAADCPSRDLSNWARHVREVRLALAEGGLPMLYKGWQATSARAAMLTSAQLGSYDTCKNNIAIPLFGLEEGIPLHFASSMFAAVFTTTASSPFDVVKTRYMCDTTGQYAGVVDCVAKTLKADGPMAFMRGWTPAYTRVTPHTVITLLMIEQLRLLLGMEPL